MVNSWVYSLQSLDQDHQIKARIPNPYALGSQGNYSTRVTDMDGSRSCPESKGPGANAKESAVQNIDFIDLNKEDDDEGKVELFEEAVQQGIGISGNTNSEEHLNSSPVNQPTACVDEQNASSSPRVSVSTRSHMVEGELTAHIDYIDLNKIDADCATSHEGEGAAVEKAVVNVSLCDNTISPEHHNCSVPNDLVCVDELNRTMPGPSGSVSTENPMLVGDPRSSKQCNGFAPSKNVLFENGFCSSDEQNGVRFSGSGKACNQIDASETEITVTSELGKPEDHEHEKDPNFPSNGTALPAEPEVTCFYRCCSGCLHTLLGLMQKLLLKEWKSGDDHWTVDDVYDTVALLSMDLLSAVRKVYAAGCSSNKFDGNVRNENHGKLSNHPEWSRCHCKSSEVAIPAQCSCHTVGTTSPNIQAGLDPEFVYRDGVMVPVDSSKEVPFHCKFDTLCLCSLIESLSMTKQLSE